MALDSDYTKSSPGESSYIRILELKQLQTLTTCSYPQLFAAATLKKESFISRGTLDTYLLTGLALTWSVKSNVEYWRHNVGALRDVIWVDEVHPCLCRVTLLCYRPKACSYKARSFRFFGFGFFAGILGLRARSFLRGLFFVHDFTVFSWPAPRVEFTFQC